MQRPCSPQLLVPFNAMRQDIGISPIYYLTRYNENYLMPPMPEGVEQGILQGMYRYRQDEVEGMKVHLLGSGSLMQEVLQAAEIIKAYGCSTDIWSVTSYNELVRDAQEIERKNMLTPEKTSLNYVEQFMAEEKGIVVAPVTA